MQLSLAHAINQLERELSGDFFRRERGRATRIELRS
jgi:hypothetical protein